MKNFFLFISFLIIFSCSSSGEKEVSGIKISCELYDNLDEKTVPKDQYIDLLKKSLNNNKNALIKFSLIDFNSILYMEQGEILINLIKKIGEKKYIFAIKDCSKNQKKIIYNHLCNGFDWNENPLYKDKNLKQVYPEIYEYLNKN